MEINYAKSLGYQILALYECYHFPIRKKALEKYIRVLAHLKLKVCFLCFHCQSWASPRGRPKELPPRSTTYLVLFPPLSGWPPETCENKEIFRFVFYFPSFTCSPTGVQKRFPSSQNLDDPPPSCRPDVHLKPLLYCIFLFPAFKI